MKKHSQILRMFYEELWLTLALLLLISIAANAQYDSALEYDEDALFSIIVPSNPTLIEATVSSDSVSNPGSCVFTNLTKRNGSTMLSIEIFGVSTSVDNSIELDPKDDVPRNYTIFHSFDYGGGGAPSGTAYFTTDFTFE